MAHVLLPCDMPSWTDVQRHLNQLKLSQNAEQLVAGMQKIHEICSIGLDPEDVPQKGDSSRFECLESFLSETLTEQEREKFFKVTLPNMVNHALRLRLVKPPNGFNYSLQQEDHNCSLDRRFVASIIANGFFSTFPKRTLKTHPTLQDLNFGEFFPNLKDDNQRDKLRRFLKYFENASPEDVKGNLRFCRQVINRNSIPSLPTWLCSDRALCPVIVRTCGKLENSEPYLYKVFSCSSRIGEGVLQITGDQEDYIFSRIPELLSLFTFVESIHDNEAVTVEGIQTDKEGSNDECNLCLMDVKDFSDNPYSQYEDKFLLRELTKVFAAFNQPSCCRRLSPVGESSSSSTCPDRAKSRSPVQMIKIHTQPPPPPPPPSPPLLPRRSLPSIPLGATERLRSEEKRRLSERIKIEPDEKKEKELGDSFDSGNGSSRHQKNSDSTSDSKNGSKGKTRRKQQSSFSSLLSKDSNQASFESTFSSRPDPLQTMNMTLLHVVSKLKDPGLPNPILSSFKVPNQVIKPTLSANSSTESFVDALDAVKKNCTSRPITSRSSSGWSSMKTASQTSFDVKPPKPGNHNSPPKSKSNGRPGHQISVEEEYFTADESDKNGNGHKQRKAKKNTANLVSRSAITQGQFLSVKPNVRQVSEDDKESRITKVSRSDSIGFVLDGSDDDESAPNLSIHERYEDFKHRIRRRSRHLSRRSSRSSRNSSFLSSSGSSDMEDIIEDPEMGGLGFSPIRSSNSEPTLLQKSPEDSLLIPPLNLPPETVMLTMGGKKLMMTTTDGQLKAYSYDGVNPNLPVPFKAKFRRRHHSGDGRDEKYVNAPDTFWYVPPPTGSAVTSPASSVEDLSEINEDTGASGSTLSKSISSKVADRNSTESERLKDLLMPNSEGKRPIATSKAVCDQRAGDIQLKATIQWLAASMAALPCIVIYTEGNPQLAHLTRVYEKVTERQWCVGDLSCEVLRYCRNKLSSHAGKIKPVTTSLFCQLIGSDRTVLTQHSLD